MTTKPIHAAVIDGKPLRFFLSPLTTRPELPWHSFDDLQACLRLPRPVRRDFQRRLQGEWKGEVRTVATPDGITIICPHYMAQGMIYAARDIGATRSTFYSDYVKAGVAAMNAITAGMTPDAAFDWSIDAARNTLKVEVTQ